MLVDHDDFESLSGGALDLIQKVVSEAHALLPESAPIEDGFVYRHANNISWLAADALFLMEKGCIAGPPIIVRVMLESVIYLAAARSHPNFPARKTVWELKGWLRRTKQLDKIREIQTKHHLDPKDREWSVSECARRSEMADFLRKDYFMMSQHSHSSAAGLLARHEGTDARTTRQTLIGSMLMASGFAPQLLPTISPQQHVDRAAALLGKLVEMIERKEI